jgi:mRNA-degrading endonuclease RelE of RelBE toxin-antitoxin system
LAWTIEFDEAAVKRLTKMAPREARRIRDFLRDRIATLANPRQLGKSLKGARLWRYRSASIAFSANFKTTTSLSSWLKLAIAERSYR